jgi:prophage regulatory protein
MTASFGEDAFADECAKGDARLPWAQPSGLSRPRSLRLPQVVVMTGLKKTTIYALQKAGRFPHSVPLTTTAVGWLEAEVEDWLAKRAAARVSALRR